MTLEQIAGEIDLGGTPLDQPESSPKEKKSILGAILGTKRTSGK